MHVTIITAFPGFFKDFLTTSIVGRAVNRGLITVDVLDLREFGRGRYRQIDDAAFGAGGQILTAPVMKDALDTASTGTNVGTKPFVVYPSPQGVMLTQDIIETLALQEHVVILCGHYEGLDERFVERFVDLEVTVGDCVLTGGEIPAMTIVDAMSRLVPDVVGREGAVQDDSFYRGMLDHPHYTRPAVWDVGGESLNAPDVLLSGNENEIKSWRRSQAIERTLTRRPDLLDQAVIGDYLAVGARLAVVSETILAPESLAAVCSLCRMYDLGRPFLVITDPAQRKAFVADMAKARDDATVFDPAPKVMGSVKRVLEQFTHHGENIEGEILVVVISQQACEGKTGMIHWRLAKRMCLESKGPVLFVICEQERETDTLNRMIESIESLNLNLKPRVIRAFLTSDACSEGKSKNILSLSARTAIALDRLVGRR